MKSWQVCKFTNVRWETSTSELCMEALLALCSFYSLTPVPYLLVGAICRAREERGQGDGGESHD